MTSNNSETKSFDFRKVDWGIIITIVISIASGAFFLGGLNTRVNLLNEKVDKLSNQLSAQFDSIEVAKKSAISTIQSSIPNQDGALIFGDGKLSSGLDMGINTSGGKTNWVTNSKGIINMSYPSNQSWGAAFITVGKSASSYPRPSRDFSNYKTLEIELKGATGNENILVGLKDREASDDGSETKVRVSKLSRDWKYYSLELAQFNLVDLRHLYIVTEFVFEGDAKTIFVRNIRYRQ